MSWPTDIDWSVDTPVLERRCVFVLVLGAFDCILSYICKYFLLFFFLAIQQINKIERSKVRGKGEKVGEIKSSRGGDSEAESNKIQQS